MKVFSFIVLAAIFVPVWAAPGDDCRSPQGSGTCRSISACTNGFTVRGACPNDPDDIRCCIQASCRNNEGVQGTCLDRDRIQCTSGNFQAGLCPGPSNVQCCLATPATCRNNQGLTGTCLNRDQVACEGGRYEAGFCPGPANIQCCLRTTCQNNQGAQGTCQNRDQTPCTGGRYEAGFCPGPANIQCCIRNPPPPRCPRYWVIGVRGSGEALGGGSEIDKMGGTVSVYVREASEVLPAADTEYLSLPYPAAPVSPAYFDSQRDGFLALQALIRGRVRDCPDIRIGLVGYSQGAHVINDALDFISDAAPSALRFIQAVLQIADPRADPSLGYHVPINFDGTPAILPQRGGVLGAKSLPAQMRGITSSVCISGDIVCDSGDKGIELFASAVTGVFHLEYKECCARIRFISVLGRGLANRLIN